MADFLPEDYKIPTKPYMKFEDGENRFRILSSPVIGWVDWKDSTPYRFRMNEKPEKPLTDKPIKHFWVVVVWNYANSRIEILEITQVGIQEAIQSYAKNPKWGHPSGYDIVVTRKGSGINTEYTTIVEPKEPISEKIELAYNDAHINLEAYFTGGDPFAGE